MSEKMMTYISSFILFVSDFDPGAIGRIHSEHMQKLPLNYEPSNCDHCDGSQPHHTCDKRKYIIEIIPFEI